MWQIFLHNLKNLYSNHFYNECEMNMKYKTIDHKHYQKYLPHVNDLCVEMACTMIDKLETLLSIHYISNIYFSYWDETTNV